jgi:ABC-type cobalamin transport system permease subunit
MTTQLYGKAKRRMVLDTGTLIGIVIALAGSLSVMGLFWRENIHLQKKVRVLQVALRDERRKHNG